LHGRITLWESVADNKLAQVGWQLYDPSLDHLKTAILLWSGEAASFSIIGSINKPQSPKANTTNNKNKPEQQDPAEIKLA
jgi:hypothetical protein